MGTKIHSKSYLPGYYSMRDLNDDSSSSTWPVYYGDNSVTNGQYYNGFIPRTMFDGYPGYDKDALKQKMLEHEAVFKNQVYELHRLYRIQRDMMEEVKRNGVHRIRESMEPSSSSSLKGSQLPKEDARKWHMPAFPLYERTSISGVVVNSPMSCTKGNSVHSSQFPFQNGSLKDSELLNSRLLKVRKKLFDLELPADEYNDIEEVKESPECKVSDMSSYAPNGNLKSEPESHIAASASASCLRKCIMLADLNEPVEIEETVAPSSTNCPGSINRDKPVGYLGVNGETMHKHDGFFISSSVESKVIERGRLPHIYETGSSKCNFDSATHGLQQDKLHIAGGIYPTGHINEVLWRDRNHHGLESSDRSHSHSNNQHLEPHLASLAPRSDPFSSSSYFPSSWTHPNSSWARPTNSFTQKITTYESCLNSAEGHETFRGKWRVSELPVQNGFYHGSTSGSKELKLHLPSAGVDYVNRSRGDIMASDRATNHGIGCFPKGTCHVDSRRSIDIDLNEVVSNSSSNEAVIVQDVAMIDEERKPEDHLSTLPWLKNNRSELKKVASNESKTEISENRTVKKILGFPIFEKNERSHVSTLASSGCASNGSNVENRRKNRMIDINLEFEPEEEIAAEERIVEKGKQTNGASIRDYIDLNSCVTDCEDTLAPSYESRTANLKTILDIDLESPVVLEKEDTVDVESLHSLENQNEESPQEDALNKAAETIFAISSSVPKIDSTEASLAESLLWFVDAVSNELTIIDDHPKEEMDEFEAMTLQIDEMKEEDYMPVPFVPEVQNPEDASAHTLSTRSRRGQSRRGRQRRDFQRDILPGLTSLSRHEVTEDLQTFGGLMRATGHHWVSGLTRRNGTRNGGGRGRRRAVVETVSTATPSPVSTPLIQQINKIEAGLEDRSLTGWGKTTRRPRRQRCPAGNPPAMVLT